MGSRGGAAGGGGGGGGTVTREQVANDLQGVMDSVLADFDEVAEVSLDATTSRRDGTIVSGINFEAPMPDEFFQPFTVFNRVFDMLNTRYGTGRWRASNLGSSDFEVGGGRRVWGVDFEFPPIEGGA